MPAGIYGQRNPDGTPVAKPGQGAAPAADTPVPGTVTATKATLPQTLTPTGAGHGDYAQIPGTADLPKTYENNPFAGASAAVGSAGAAGDTITEARQVRDNLLNQYNASAPRPAPTTNGAVAQPVGPAQAATVAAPTSIPSVAVGGPPQATAATVAAPTAIPHTQVGNGTAFQAVNPADVQAKAVQAATIAPTTQVAPTTVAATAPTSAERVDTSVQQHNATGQGEALGLLRQAATGAGPTAADATFQKNLDKSIYAQRSLASSAHGPGRTAAALKAGSNIAQMTGQAAADAAALKAQEQQTAQQALLSGYTGARGQDIGLGTTNAQLGTQVALANQGTGLATNLKQADVTSTGALANAAASNTAAGHQADLTQGASTDTAKLALQAAQGNQSTSAQVAISNAQASNDIQKLQAQIDSQQGIATAEQANQLKALQAQLTTNVSTSNTAVAAQLQGLQAQISSQQGIATAEQANQLKALQAQLTNQTSLANMTEAGANSRAQLASDTQTNLANLDSQLKSRGLDDTQRQALLAAYTQAANQATASGASLQAAQIAGDSAVHAAEAGSPGLAGAVLGTIGTISGAALGGPAGGAIGKAILSDERQKKDIKPLLDHYTEGGVGGDEDAVDRLLSQLHPATFEYKDPSMPGAGAGKQAGVMAQDLEKSPMGRTMVIEDQGVKKIDPSHAVGALLAAMTVMNRNMKALKEARR